MRGAPGLVLGFLIFFEIFDLAGFLTILLFSFGLRETWVAGECPSSTFSFDMRGSWGAIDLDLGLLVGAASFGAATRLADRDLNWGVFLVTGFVSLGLRWDFSGKFFLIDDVEIVRLPPVALIFPFLSGFGCLVVFFLRSNVGRALFSGLSIVVKLASPPPKSSATLVFFLVRDSEAGLALGLCCLSAFFVSV
jgi:hypothetical protein